MSEGKIMIIDDERDVREIVKFYLGSEDYQILEATNGEEAIRCLHTGNNLFYVGVIFCDIEMPRVNGIEFIEYLMYEAPGIPVVVITENPNPEMAVKLMQMGVRDYLIKPINKDDLLDVINQQFAVGKDFSY